MNITIIGTCLADLGNKIFCLDIDQAKIDLLSRGGVPVYELGQKK